jgi:hypothetical protein
MQPSASTVVGAASEEPDAISMRIAEVTRILLTCTGLVFSWSRKDDLVTRRVQDVEEGTEVCLRPSIVV